MEAAQLEVLHPGDAVIVCFPAHVEFETVERMREAWAAQHPDIELTVLAGADHVFVKRAS
jgi:hypothetical protein